MLPMPQPSGVVELGPHGSVIGTRFACVCVEGGGVKKKKIQKKK